MKEIESSITCGAPTSSCLSKKLRRYEIVPPYIYIYSSPQAAHPIKRKLSVQISINKPITRRKQSAAVSHRVGFHYGLASARLQAVEIYKARRNEMIIKTGYD